MMQKTFITNSLQVFVADFASQYLVSAVDYSNPNKPYVFWN